MVHGLPPKKTLESQAAPLKQLKFTDSHTDNTNALVFTAKKELKGRKLHNLESPVMRVTLGQV
jgi:hypothetical protein